MAKIFLFKLALCVFSLSVPEHYLPMNKQVATVFMLTLYQQTPSLFYPHLLLLKEMQLLTFWFSQLFLCSPMICLMENHIAKVSFFLFRRNDIL